MDPMTAYYGLIAVGCAMFLTFLWLALGYPLFLIWRQWRQRQRKPDRYGKGPHAGFYD